MSEIREMQLCIVDMIKKVNTLFRENNIEYFLLGGSVLGSIRHKGFIPWDDDMDIGIKRNQFKKAEELLKTLREYVYEPIENHIIPDAPIGHLHLVNEKYPIENSPTIDVFALDGVPENEKKWKKIKWLAYWYHLAILGRPARNRGVIIKFLTWTLLKIIPKSGWKIIRKKTLARVTSIDIECARKIANIWGAWGFKEYFSSDMFESASYEEFEGLKLPLPADPDKYLTQMYGNYMELPPLEKRVPRHREF